MLRPPWITAERLTLAAVLIFTLALRGGVLWALRSHLSADPDAYRQIAENVLRHGVFAMGTGERPQPTAYRPPLYPLVLSNLPAADGLHVSLTKVAVLHVLLGVATVWLTWLIALKVGSSRREEPAAGGAVIPRATEPEASSFKAPVPHGVRDLVFPTLAALLVACDPILLNQQALVMTETLATFLAALALWCLTAFGVRRSWFWAALSGAAIGLAALSRPTFLPWVGLVGLAGLIQNSEFRRQKAGQRASWRLRLEFRLAAAVALLTGASIVIAPWAVRNYRVFGKPIASTTHGGYTLWLGNNDSFYDWLTQPHDTPWEARPDAFDHLNGLRKAGGEPSADSAWYQGAQRTIERRPRDFLRACLYRVGQLWSPLPNKLTANESTGRRLLRFATCTWYCGLYGLAAFGAWRLRSRMLRPPWIYGLLLCLTFTAVHTFYWTNLRMRAPLMPCVALLAVSPLLCAGTKRGPGAT